MKIFWMIVVSGLGGFIIASIFPFPWSLILCIIWGSFIGRNWDDIWDHFNID